MIIYKENSEVLLELQPQLVRDDSYRLKEIMGQNIVVLYFSLPNYIEIPVGSYIEYKAEIYHLSAPQSFKKVHTRFYEYTLEMHSDAIKTNDILIKFEGEIKFSLTATPSAFAQLIIDNMNNSDSGWQVGSVIESEPVTVDFNKESCYSAVRKVAEAFKTEYEFENKVLHIHKIEREVENAVDLSYGYGNGIQSGLTRQQYDSSKVINRLYVETSERNLNSAIYGSKRLKMPPLTNIEYNGVQYVTSADGFYLERTAREGKVVEGVLDATKHYPTRVGIVSSVSVVDSEMNLYDIFDTSIPSDLNYTDNIIEGETMTIIFQTGQLAGKEFDVSYTHADRRFELVPLTDNGEIYPTGTLVPTIGDKYKVFGISMPETYIQDASMRVLQDAVAFLNDNEKPKFTYRWKLDGIYAKKNWLEIGGYLEPGYFINFSDPSFMPEPLPIRITAVKEYVKRPKSPEIDISNSVPGKSIANIIRDLPSKDQTIDRKTDDVRRYSQRRFADAQETISMLQAAFDDFDPAIDPIAIQTMSLLVGAESLQFRFVNSKTTLSVVTPNIVYSSTQKKISVPSGIIQHMSIGITSISPSHQAAEYRFWDMPSYTSPALTDGDKSYYLYAWVAKSGDTGAFLLKETAMPFDSGDYYYLLVGTLGKEIDGSRSYTSVYGFSEILPGRITTDMIKSPTGHTYFNLSAGNGAGEIGGVIKFLAGSTGLENLQGWQDLVQDVEDASTAAGNAESAAAALDYIKQAILDGSTTVAGGLVLANLLMLKGTDNVVRAGLSGLQDDNLFLFADPSNAYAKALEGTAMFIMRKDGTSKIGIMRVDTDNVGLYKAGTEMMQFRTAIVPTRDDLISSVDQTVQVPGGSAIESMSFNSNFGNSDPIVVSSPISSFSLQISGLIQLGISNDYATPISLSQITCRVVLEKLQDGSYIFDRVLSSHYLFSEEVDILQEDYLIDSTINLAAGSYRARVEYYGSTNDPGDTCSVSSSIAMHAQGAHANECIIFGTNGLVRIKNGTNYSLFSDEAVEHKFGVDKYLLIDSNGIKARGGFDVPGFRGSGSVSSAGGLIHSFGKVTNSSRTSQGIYAISHDIGHVDYAVNLTLYNSNAQLTAVVTSKYTNSFQIKIVNPSNNSLTDSSFDFTIHADA